MNIKRNLLVGIAIIGCGVSSVHAATATSTFTVSATVASACSISATNMTFNSDYDPVAPVNIDSTSTLNVTCTSGTAYTVGLSQGTGAGATVATRKMTSGPNTLDYSLFQGADRIAVWGETIGTNTVAGTGTGVVQPLTVYGRLFALQGAVPAGLYNDTITATVTY